MPSEIMQSKFRADSVQTYEKHYSCGMWDKG